MKTDTKSEANIGALLEKYKPQIAAALPKHLTIDRMMRIVFSEIRRIPKLAECSVPSIISSAIECSLLGLEPGGVRGHAYLLPYKKSQKNKNGTWESWYESQFILGYRGMIELIGRSGKVESLEVKAVHEKDYFEVEHGLHEKLKFIPKRTERGSLIGVYALARLCNGGHQFDVMWKEDIEEIRKHSKASENGPWVTHYEEMAKKTALKRIFKYLPSSIEMQRAILLDEAGEIGEQSHIIETDFSLTETDELIAEKKREKKADKIANALGNTVAESMQPHEMEQTT